MVEQWTFNPFVAGSIPALPTKYNTFDLIQALKKPANKAGFFMSSIVLSLIGLEIAVVANPCCACKSLTRGYIVLFQYLVYVVHLAPLRIL